MTEHRDSALIAMLVEREVESRSSWAAFANTSGVSRATLYRVQNRDPRISRRIHRQIARGLGMPVDTLPMVGAHDFDGLLAEGVDPKMVQWLRDHATEPDELADPLDKGTREAVEQARAEHRAGDPPPRSSAGRSGMGRTDTA